jgi:hypothetical protein
MSPSSQIFVLLQPAENVTLKPNICFLATSRKCHPQAKYLFYCNQHLLVMKPGNPLKEV